MSRGVRRGFTLVELVVVVGIVGLMVGLTLSAVQRVRAAAARTNCGDRLRQLGLAFHHFHDARGALPAGVAVKEGPGVYQYLNWEARLLPYLDQGPLWRQAEEAFGANPNVFGAPHPIAVPVPAFACPADPHAPGPRAWQGGMYAFTSYLGVSGTRRTRHDGVLFADSKTKLTDVLDGTSYTLLAGERPSTPDGVFGWWYAGGGQRGDGSAESVLSTGEVPSSVWFNGCPGGRARFGPGRLDEQCDGLHFWSLHPGGAHFLFCDGSVRYFPYAAADLLPALATRAGGEPGELP
ncbi:MAG: DUF1559 domain-containing protein [Gemmataceae bacterium]|nr:DUF1559 domain-containing protein [Gemmataceae bacterium]